MHTSPSFSLCCSIYSWASSSFYANVLTSSHLPAKSSTTLLQTDCNYKMPMIIQERGDKVVLLSDFNQSMKQQREMTMKRVEIYELYVGIDERFRGCTVITMQ
ncbi:hypothetical protein Leryth_023256 [Lithospermum erythrorhizon]|nr:hypothetical protein Leryth_023256 [Lithospermum erythrorhizon]